LTEANAVLLEEIMIIQLRAVFKAMLPSTHDAMLTVSSIWVLADGMHSTAMHVVSQQVIGSFFLIRDVNLQEVDACLIIRCERLRSIITWIAVVMIMIFFRISPIRSATAASSTSSSTSTS